MVGVPENRRPVLTPSIEGCGFHLGQLPSIALPAISLNPLDRRVWFSSNPVEKKPWRFGVVLTPSIEGCGFHLAAYKAASPSVGLNPLDRRVWFSSKVGSSHREKIGVLTPSIEGCGFHPGRAAAAPWSFGGLNPLDRRVWFSSFHCLVEPRSICLRS